jgi:hypothetical protein
MQFQTVRQTVREGLGTVRVGGWGVGRKQFAREVDWKIGVTGTSQQSGDWPVKRDIIIDRKSPSPKTTHAMG